MEPGEPTPAGADAIPDVDGFGQERRLELDELLEQLIGRARDVQATQGREPRHRPPRQ